jgi:hypothetical protein
MAHQHELEFQAGSKRIICMHSDCDFVMEQKDIIALVGLCIRPTLHVPDDGDSPASEILSTGDVSPSNQVEPTPRPDGRIPSQTT